MINGTPKALERTHLETEISEILNKPLMIITAPSGYGKTTLVRSFFLKHPTVREFYLSLGRTAVDEVWVWQRLCTAFKEYNPKLSDTLWELGLPCTKKELDSFIAVVQGFISRPVCIILDDYHECNGRFINRLIERIVYEEITNLHIILISRTLPDISYEEMYLKGYCTTLDQNSLALSREESKQVFLINGVTLSESELSKMYAYTDGWIAAVYLALYDYKRMGCFHNLTNITRLLKTAIWDKLSDSMKEICTKMSLFEHFTLNEASYMLEREISETELAQIQDHFGFIQHDITSGIYIMHALLKSVAQQELEKQHLDKRHLFIRCGQYNEKNKHYVRALKCYKSAGANDMVLALLSCEIRNVIFEQAPTIVRDLFSSIPTEEKMNYPAAFFSYIYSVIIRENSNRGRLLYHEALSCYENTTFEDLSYAKNLRGELFIIESLLDFNDLEKANAKLKKAYELLEHQPSSIFGHSLLTYGTPFMTVLYYNKSGNLQKTIALEKEYAVYYMRLTKGIDSGWDNFFEAEYALMKGDITNAVTLSGKVTQKAIFAKGLCIAISGYYIHLRCLIYQGKTQEFNTAFSELAAQMEGVISPILTTDYELACAYIFACIGQIDRIPEWIRRFNLENCSRLVRNVRSGCIAYGIILYKQREWDLLDAVADQILSPYENTIHIYILVFGYIFKAIAAYHLEGLEKGCDYLLKAVALSEPDGMKLPFIEHGASLLPMVEKLSAQNSFCASLKFPIKEYRRGITAFETVQTAKAALTARETELMGLVKTGLSNNEISARMNIALVTVEKNLTNIYRKLGVTNRTSAVAKLEEMELL